MADIVQFPDSPRADVTHVHEDAALWLARLDKGLTAEERPALAAWLGESRAHRDALLELAALWDGLDVLAELSDLFPLERERTPPRRKALSTAAFAAASVAALALVGWIAFLGSGRLTAVDETPVAAAPSATYATAIGGHATQALGDGSLIAMNTDTEVEVKLAAATRDVFMRRGEAHFTVAHDPARPFRVHVGGRVLEAVGTAFNVHLKPAGSVEVTVTDGTVKVARDGGADAAAAAGRAERADDSASVVQGELAVLDPGVPGKPAITRLEMSDIDVKLAWQRGMLIFQGEPLQQILDEFSRYTTTRFVLEGEELRRQRVGGYFRAGDVDGLLLALREGFNIDFERVGTDRVVLRTSHAPR
jgi:transmembrane sensor